MKHLKLSLIPLGVVLIIGCSMESDAPKLISPQEGEVFDTVPPTFIWSSQELVEGYVIQVYEPVPPPLIQDYLIREKLDDTTYAFPETLFRDTPIDTLHWLVGSKAFEGVYWSEVRSFVIDKPEPGDPTAPALISPANGSVLDTVPPTFTWSSDSLSYGYLFRIWTNSTTEVEDSLGDTTYAMSQEFFDGLAEGTYNWVAATVSASGKKFWSEAWTFTIERPEPITDLDTTYFPFGLGYEWRYEKKKLFSEDSKDTVAVIVVDSFWIDNTLFFKLEGGSFFDVGNSVEIEDGKIKAFDETINLLPEEQSSYLWIRYYGDTLYMFTGDEPYPDYWEDWSVYRIKAIGLIHQIYYWQDVYENTSGGDRYSLLWFYNSKDTVYKAKD